MTNFFAYDELTWPEVATLRRDTPLVIPLGEGYDLARLAEALSDPAAVGLLPPIPYGWPGSGLQTAAAPFARMLANMLESLQDDGFSRVYALHPQGLELGLGVRGLAQWHSSQLRTTMAANALPGGSDESLHYELLPADDEREKCVLIPIGHTEQHGHHLPLSTDTHIIGAIGQGTAAAVPDLAICLPPFPYGASTCLLYTSPSPRDGLLSRMPSSA